MVAWESIVGAAVTSVKIISSDCRREEKKLMVCQLELSWDKRGDFGRMSDNYSRAENIVADAMTLLTLIKLSFRRFPPY